MKLIGSTLLLAIFATSPEVSTKDGFDTELLDDGSAGAGVGADGGGGGGAPVGLVTAGEGGQVLSLTRLDPLDFSKYQGSV